MTSLKADIKAGAVYELGEKLEDLLERSRTDFQKLDGARQALTQAADKIEVHARNIDRDLDERKIADLEQAKDQKKRIFECHAIVKSLIAAAEVNSHVARGKIEALATVVKTTKVQHDLLRSKAEELRKLEAEDSKETGTETPTRRVVGQHPGPTLKTQRRARKKVARTSKKKKSSVGESK